MRRALLTLLPLLFAASAFAAPTQRFALYQGRYTSAGAASNGNVVMEFRVTDGAAHACGAAVDNTSVFWTSGSTAVFTTNGLFSYRLGSLRDGATPDPVFGAINWGGRDYYIDVCANSVSLNPKEPIGAGIYSYYSNFASSASFATAASAILTGGAGTAAVIDATQTFTGQNAFNGQVTVSSSIFINGVLQAGSGIALTGGSLGVGTGSPQYIADIVSNSTDVVRFTHASGGVGNHAYLGLTSGINGGHSARIGVVSMGGGNASVVFEVNNNGTPGSDATTEALRILNTGNVGIGTTSPGQKLSVAGTVESTSGGFKFPDGTTQITASAAGATGVAVVAGTQTFSGSNTFISSITVNGALGLDGPLNMNSGKITGLGGPAASTDGATKGYVDAATATLATTAYVDAATATIAGSQISTAYVAAATSTLASTSFVATATGSLTSASYVAAATAPFAGGAYLGSNQTFAGVNTFSSSATFTASSAALPTIKVSSGLIVASGYLGVGIATPVYSGDFNNGDTDVLRLTNIKGSGTGSHAYLMMTVGSHGGVSARVGSIAYPSSNGGLGFEVNNNSVQGSSTTAEAMRITNAGNVGIGTTVPASKLQVQGPISTATTTVTTSYPMTSSDSVVFADATSAPLTVTLPAASASTIGRMLYIYKIDSSANAVTVAGAGSDTVLGTTSLSAQGNSAFVMGQAATQWISK